MRSLNQLTARTVQALSAPGRYADGGNLFLSYVKNGGKSWTFLYRDRNNGRVREMGLGSLGAVSLADARQRAAAARFMLATDVDPLADKKARKVARQKARTFGDFCDEFLGSALAGFNNDKHRYQWRTTLTKDAAALRPRMLQDITTDDVRKTLEPIWHTKHETARRLRQQIERVLDAAKAGGLREGDNPARWKGNLQAFFGTQRRTKEHYPAVHYKDMPSFMGELRERESASALALEYPRLSQRPARVKRLVRSGAKSTLRKRFGRCPPSA